MCVYIYIYIHTYIYIITLFSPNEPHFSGWQGSGWFISALPHQMIARRACRWSVFNKYWQFWFFKNSRISYFVICKMEIRSYQSHLQDLFHFQQHQSMSPDCSIKSCPLVMVQHDSVCVCVCVCIVGAGYNKISRSTLWLLIAVGLGFLFWLWRWYVTLGSNSFP